MFSSDITFSQLPNAAKPSDSFFIRHNMAISFTVVTILILLVGGMFYWQSLMVEHAKKWVVHTYEVSRRIQVLSNKFKDAELGQRGYILIGDYRYLEPYNDAIRESIEVEFAADPMVQHHSIPQAIAALKALTADNPKQKDNLDQLESVAREIMEYWEVTINMRRSGKTPIEIHGNDGLRGKQLMDRIRKIIRAMIIEENRLLTLRTEADEVSSRWNIWVTFLGITAFYIGMMISVWFAARHWNRARKAEADVYTSAVQIAEANHELQATNEQLSEFTQELQRSEEELKVQQEELEASNEEMEEKNRVLEEQNLQIRQQSQALSEHRQALEKKARELELSSKYKSEFLANMSHELRTPLNSLLILARSLANNEEGNLTPEQKEEASIIHSGGLELLGLINDILDLSKVEAGKLNIIPENVAPYDILKRLEQKFEPIAEQSGLTFKVLIADDVPPHIFTDSQRVEQILKNLLSNAFKFTNKGSVELSIKRMKNGSSQRLLMDPDKAIAFSVTDTGIGIEESKLKDIFEAFQQEDGSTDRHYGGTGLGLTIARKFAHMLGGEIQVSSSKGQGSTFTLVLPISMVSRETEEIPQQENVAVTPLIKQDTKETPRSLSAQFIPDDRKIIEDKDKVLLIIEDDPGFATILLKTARQHGYKGLAAGDGKTGLLFAHEYNVSAIILDLNLPDIDGLNILDQLKHNLKTRHIPVHIVTGRDPQNNVVPLRKGAIGYLTKPVSLEDIEDAFARIENLLSSQIKKILVVEDDKKTCVAIQSLLKKQDIEITFSETGQEALQQIKANRFDCIILDLSLPDMTGFQWLEAAENHANKEQQAPVIIYTAKELSENENRLLSQYTGSIIIKGVSSSERLLDEVTLFLHSVESTLTSDQQKMIRMHHDPDKALQGRTILLVDDDMRNVFALSKILKKRGLNIIIADNGQMALEKLREEKSIELIIMDIMMPIMDGYEAMQSIRAINEYQHLPIIALTARAMPEEQDRCMETGANDYMTKPVDVERLLTLIRVWLFRQEKAA